MSHLDEGLLTALLDNELAPAERLAAETHLGECADCRRLLEEVKAVASEADGLVEAVQLPVRRAPADAANAPTRRSRWKSSRWRVLAWAASVTLALGLGWMASDLRQPHSPVAGPGESAAAAPSAAVMMERLRDSAKPAAAPPVAANPERLARQSASPEAAREDRRTLPAADAAKGGAAKVTGNVVATEADRLAEMGAPAANAPAPAAPAIAPAEMSARALSTAQASGFRQVGMEEAVRTLSGSIRLVDGLRPRSILISPGRSAPGADASMDVVRVVYEDPPGRELWLDQQRPADAEGRAKTPAGGALLAGDTVIERAAGGPASVRWVDQRGFRLGLTGFLETDSLRAMIRRVY